MLAKSLVKNKNFKKIIIKNKHFYKNIIENKKYDLVINCDARNEISKKYFFKNFLKNYKSTAYVTIINHSYINNNNATQIFTKYGPIAFLPVSHKKTSVVFSIKNKSIKIDKKLSQKILEKLISNYNKIYKIKSIEKFETFKLKSKNLRNYYYKNILAFGDMLHQIHPLSGQGFNMSLRDIKVLIDLLNDRQNLGLPIDYSVCSEFENNTKHLNFLFTTGNDFIYEFFNYDNFYSKAFSKNMFSYFNKNDFLKKIAIKFADKGLSI